MPLSYFRNACIACCATLMVGCASAPKDLVEAQIAQTLRGVPVKITPIKLPTRTPYSIEQILVAQVASGFAWGANSSFMGHKTIRINTRTREVAALPRPFTWGFADLLIHDGSMWFSAGAGDLVRADINTNVINATIDGAGLPFAAGGGGVWAYKNRTVSKIDTKDNRVVQKINRQCGGNLDFSCTYGAGSLWQFAYRHDVSSWAISRGAVPDSLIRRIDPDTNRVLAEIPLGPFRLSDYIRFVAGGIWVLGVRDKSFKPFAIRIDVDNNRVAASIPLVRSMEKICGPGYPKTPVHVKGAVWISTQCSDRMSLPGVLLKIDLQSNQVTDEIAIANLDDRRISRPMLAAGDGQMWGFDGHYAYIFEFQ